LNTVTIISFLLFTAFVAILTYYKTKGKHVGDSQDGYYLGGRSLTAGVIAGSLLLTNLNAISFVGMTAQAYKYNMSVMSWEVASGLTLVIVALYLVPRYLRQGITTIPDFLESRFDNQTKMFVTILFLVSYIVNLLPPTLYSGALALVKIFNVQAVFGVSEVAAIWILVWSIGLIGAAYAIFGGLRAIAVSDTINGIGLLIGGLAVPFFALSYLGDGNIMAAFSQITTVSTAKLNSVGSNTDPVPFATLFTGMFLVNMYYWGTDQSIIQRALGAKNLNQAQKGVMIAGLFKVLTPFIIIVPGIIAFHIYGGNAFKNPDTVYSTLVSDVLPKWLTGFFAAVMFGAILSTFNSVLNSASTLFSLNVIKPLSKKKHTDQDMVRIGRNFAIIIAILSMFIAPLIMYAPQGIFQYFLIVAGFFNVPIFTIILIGYTTKRVPAIAAKISLVIFVASYASMQLIFKPELNFLHQLGILFVICVTIMLIIGKFCPRKEPYIIPKNNIVDMKPWKGRFIFGSFIAILMIGMYVAFSPLGFVRTKIAATPGQSVWWIISAVIVLIIGYALKKKYNPEDSNIYK
jgi:solute:Na+ symporter, SSS family